MKLTPLDIQRHEFQRRTFRGLDADEVRTFLNGVSEEMGRLRSDNEKLGEEVRRLNVSGTVVAKMVAAEGIDCDQNDVRLRGESSWGEERKGGEENEGTQDACGT